MQDILEQVSHSFRHEVLNVLFIFQEVHIPAEVLSSRESAGINCAGIDLGFVVLPCLPFLVTDNNPLIFLNTLNPNQELMQWLFLQPYNMDIRHIWQVFAT